MIVVQRYEFVVRPALVEHEQEVRSLVAEQEMEGGSRFIEHRPEIALALPNDALGRRDAREIVQVKGARPAVERHAINEIVLPDHLNAVGRGERAVARLGDVAPHRVLHVIGEMQDAVVAIGHVEAHVAGILDPAGHEGEIVVVLGRIDLRLLGNGREDMAEDRHQVADIDLRGALQFLHGVLVQAHAVAPLARASSTDGRDRQSERYRRRETGPDHHAPEV